MHTAYGMGLPNAQETQPQRAVGALCMYGFDRRRCAATGEELDDGACMTACGGSAGRDEWTCIWGSGYTDQWGNEVVA